jgi:hypothetical protein
MRVLLEDVLTSCGLGRRREKKLELQGHLEELFCLSAPRKKHLKKLVANATKQFVSPFGIVSTLPRPIVFLLSLQAAAASIPSIITLSLMTMTPVIDGNTVIGVI